MSDKVNFACPVVYLGDHYDGFTVHPGVDLSLEDAWCDSTRKIVKFANTQTKPVVFYDGISSYEVDAKANPRYLQIKAG